MALPAGAPGIAGGGNPANRTEDVEAYNRIFDVFEEEHPNITVEHMRKRFDHSKLYIIDDRIPEVMPENGLEGRVSTQYSSVDDGRGVARLSGADLADRASRRLPEGF